VSRRGFVARTSFGLLAATLAGCGGGEVIVVGTSTLDPGDCKGGVTAPFTVQELLEGMRARGYDMYVDPGCSDDSVSWSLSNTSVHVPELEPQDFDRALAREGVISCDIYENAEGGGTTVRRYEPKGKNWRNLQVLNVSCDISADPAQQAEQTDRLILTLNELAASR
jgi:hypothetical protein